MCKKEIGGRVMILVRFISLAILIVFTTTFGYCIAKKQGTLLLPLLLIMFMSAIGVML